MVTLSRYMALHVGDTAPPGTAWVFNKDIKWVIKVIKKIVIVIIGQNHQESGLIFKSSDLKKCSRKVLPVVVASQTK